MPHITIAGQTTSFIVAFMTGAALCLVYDFFRILRLASKPSRPAMFIQDIIFWLICALITFGLLLVRCNGMIRGYAILGELLGFAACRNSISLILMKISGAMIGAIRRIKRFLQRTILRPIARTTRKFTGFLDKTSKKAGNILKKGLKQGLGLLYNRIKAKKEPERKESGRDWIEYTP